MKIKFEVYEEGAGNVEIEDISKLLTKEAVIPQKGDRVEYGKEYFTVDFICYNVKGNLLLVEVFAI